MKKTIFFFLLTLTCLTALYAEQKFPFRGVVKGESVNVRSGGNQNFEVVCQLKNKEIVNVVDKKYSWYKIILPEEAEAYVFAEFVQEQNGKIISEVSNLNIRARPLIKSVVIGKLDKGDSVQIKEKIDGWYKITPNHTCYGWIHEEYLEYLDDKVMAEPREQILEGNIKANFNELKTATNQLSEIKGTLRIPWGGLQKIYSYKLVTPDGEIYYLKFKTDIGNSNYDYKKVILLGMVTGQYKDYPEFLVEKMFLSE